MISGLVVSVIVVVNMAVFVPVRMIVVMRPMIVRMVMAAAGDGRGRVVLVD